MEIMIPVWPERAEAQAAASDLDRIAGVSIAFVDDYLDPDFTDELEKRLAEEAGALVKHLVKPVGNAAAPKTMIEEAAQCRVAVVGLAMCGSCTAGVVLDAVALEKKGVHTVTIVTDAFEKAARMAARVHGMPDISFAVIPARQGSDTRESQRAKARAALAQVVELLLVNQA
jgi:hypothetical protein